MEISSLQQKIAIEAKRWTDLKVPYKHRGKTIKGCDCSGLLVGIMQSLGYLKNFVMPIYPPDWHLHSFAYKHEYIKEYLSRYAHLVEIEVKQPGDVLLFKYAKVICHTGIYVGNDLFVHSYLLCSVSYGTLKNSPYREHLVEVWRIDEDKLK